MVVHSRSWTNDLPGPENSFRPFDFRHFVGAAKFRSSMNVKTMEKVCGQSVKSSQVNKNNKSEISFKDFFAAKIVSVNYD